MKIILILLAVFVARAEIKVPEEMSHKWNEFSTAVSDNYGKAKRSIDETGRENGFDFKKARNSNLAQSIAGAVSRLWSQAEFRFP
jgi:hypothetical protein